MLVRYWNTGMRMHTKMYSFIIPICTKQYKIINKTKFSFGSPLYFRLSHVSNSELCYIDRKLMFLSILMPKVT